jgi:hypothetical protein
MHNTITFVIVLGAVLYCVALWFYVYTVEGDIRTPFENCSKYEEIRCAYQSAEDKTAIVDRLHKLAIYKRYEVLWPFTFLGSSLAAYLILVATGAFSAQNLIITIPIIFVTIDLSRRWVDCHRHGGIDIEATQLMARYKEL